MSRDDATRCLLLLVVALGVPGTALGDSAAIDRLAKCQKAIAREGARYAQRVIKSNLDCTEAVAECQVECDEGIFGPPCGDPPEPGCCDSDDPGSNASFGACMTAAQALCDAEVIKRAGYETRKQEKITASCASLTQDELCGAQAVGLNFVTLNAGCQAIDPNYTCTLTNLVQCVGGPLERAHLDQITAILSPRASDAIAALNLEAQFPDVPVARKVKGAVAAGQTDVWAFTGQAGDEIVARVNTRDDTGTGSSNLHPVLALLDGSMNPVADTPVRGSTCGVPTVCGSSCPLLKRTLPFDGTFKLAVQAFSGDACAGGKYTLTVITPGGVVPTPVANGVTTTTTP